MFECIILLHPLLAESDEALIDNVEFIYIYRRNHLLKN